MRNYKKLLQDLVEWRDWCLDEPNETRGHIAYHLDEILKIADGVRR